MRFFSAGGNRHMVLVTPASTSASGEFSNAYYDGGRYTRLIGNMQRLRGRVYLEDGAIDQFELLPDGRHRQAVDYESWHLLLVDAKDRVYGCARYRPCEQPVRFRDLGVGRSELARSEFWASRLHQAVQHEIWNARERGLSFVEVGGWALAEDVRLSPDALRVALSTWALAQMLGGCIGVTTATVRHSSSTILRKIGGSDLVYDGEYIPRYFDPRYGCDMDILRFDSTAPSSRYEPLVAQMREALESVPVVIPGDDLAFTAAQAASARAAEIAPSSLQLVPQFA